MLIRALLKYAGGAPWPKDANLVPSAKWPTTTVNWALEAGLGPLLLDAIRENLVAVPFDLRNRLVGAELTALVEHGDRIDTAAEVLELCAEIHVPVTLLKGISICGQHYARGHHRPMTDIDLLVPAQSYATIEGLLLQRGYRPGTHTLGPDPHHGIPMADPRRGVWLELHTALFHRGSMLRRNGAFDTVQIQRESKASCFLHLPVNRLSGELQLAYIASYWTQDLTNYHIHPSFLTPMFDAVRLIANDRTLDWSKLLTLASNEAVRTSLYVLLAYLSTSGIVAIPPNVLHRLSREQSLVGSVERRVLLSMIDHYLVAGREFRLFNSWHVWSNLLEPGTRGFKVIQLPWRILFPPHYPDRYSLRRQRRRMLERARRMIRRYRTPD